MSEQDEVWMQRALGLARQALRNDRVPVAALVVLNGQLVGEACNLPVSATDPTGHAEILALRAAGAALADYRLPGCDVYVTVEPCAMCAGAMVHARIRRLVFGAPEPRAGAVLSHLQLLDQPHLNHRVQWRHGVLASPCAELMLEFFRSRRRRGMEAATAELPRAASGDLDV